MPDESQPGQLTSLSLLTRARANDQDAWARLTSLYRPLVTFWCRRARCPAEEVEDVTQEVFAAAAAGLAAISASTACLIGIPPSRLNPPRAARTASCCWMRWWPRRSG